MTAFNQLYSSNLYETQSQSEDIGWCGYILNPDSLVELPESGVTLESLFSTAYPNGIFIFSATAPDVTDTESADNFAKSILDYLIAKHGSGGVFGYYALVWLSDLTTLNSNTVKEVTLSYTTFFNVVSPLSYNPSNNLELAIESNSPCSLQGDLFNFFNTNMSSPTLFMNSQIQTVDQNSIENIYIPTNGPLLGCLAYSLKIPSTNYNFPENLATLNYFYPGKNNTTDSFNYLTFDSNLTESLGDYYIALDPNNQLNSGGLLRTFMVPMTESNVPTILPSGFSTDSGLQLGLASVLNLDAYPETTFIWMPTDATGMIVFADNQPEGSTGIDYDYIPSGQFSMSLWNNDLSDQSTIYNLLCGLSGIETFSFIPATNSYTGDVLSFWPGNNAYAPLYIPPSEGTQQSGAAALDNTYSTSWISVGVGEDSTSDNSYYSQPTGASLYAPGYGVSKSSPNFLGFFEPVACIIENGSTPIPFPMMPYRLLDLTTSDSESDYSDFELKIISTIRKSELEPTIQSVAEKSRSMRKSKLMTDAESDTLVTSTSPQGLLVEVDTTSNVWTELILAKNTNINEESDPAITMEFLNLNSTLQSAFQTNQQFLVISWNKPITEGGIDYVLYGDDGDASNFANEMMIEGWPFIANVPTENPNGVFTNVLIFKFCNGALMDQVNDSSTWTSPELFNSTENGNLDQLQSWITDYCDTGISKYSDGDTNYAYFSEIVQDPNWNGILLLQSNISVQDFPPELQGLLAGIDLTRFYGHHFGINVNHISVDESGNLAMSPLSSLFGLIDYTDSVFDQYNDNIDEYLENVSPPSGDYNYKVLSLKVLFGNSAILNFDSYVQLAINTLYGSEVTAQNNANIIIFTGTYEDQDGDPNYIFNETGENLLPLDNSALIGVEIIKANFVTEQPQSGQDSSMVYVKFSFWGFMNFSDQTFDLYSFGSEKKDDENQFIPGDGLSYANMTIEMNFALETSSVQFFTFSVKEMSFDLGQSNWRQESLYGHFPLQLTGILTGDSDSQPSSQGYISMPIPDMVGPTTWTGTWYGLVFNLNMGTMGDLSSSLGFNSTFLMVWTAGSSAQMGAMLSLPGLSSESKALSLQSVLSLNIGSLLLQTAQNQDSESLAYMMSMNKITLKFLSFSFPPSGAIDFYLFGDPDANTQPSSLGWYLGYQKDA
ncbi:MAG: hypothetical protein ACJASQ_003098 [Crocinitomicaceae bacterium]|jgi:hypothetical protein